MSTTRERFIGYVRVYRDVARQWRWQKIAANGQVVSVSGEGFKRRRHAMRMVGRLFPGVPVRVEPR